MVSSLPRKDCLPSALSHRECDALTPARCDADDSTPWGVVYSREAILANLLEQKRAHKQKARQAERERSEAEAAEAAAREREEREREEAFHRRNHEGASEGPSSAAGKAEDAGGKLAAFWLPSKTPSAPRPPSDAKAKAACLCPATGRTLRLKDLVRIKFARDPADPTRWLDPLSGDELTRRDVLVAIRVTGDVMKRSTYERLVKPTGTMPGGDGDAGEVTVDPKRDVIPLRRGGTGFAAHDPHAQSSKRYVVGMGNGLADIRGQSAGPRSAFGLSFAN